MPAAGRVAELCMLGTSIRDSSKMPHPILTPPGLRGCPVAGFEGLGGGLSVRRDYAGSCAILGLLLRRCEMNDNSSWCEKCGEHALFALFGGYHKCQPKWTVVCKEFGWEMDIHAHSAKEAATDAVERRDSQGDYLVVSGHPVIVTVAGKRYEVTGESVPRYTAEEV